MKKALEGALNTNSAIIHFHVTTDQTIFQHFVVVAVVVVGGG